MLVLVCHHLLQGALRAGMANLAVQAVSGQGINFGEALT
jgi:hypothetical protein